MPFAGNEEKGLAAFELHFAVGGGLESALATDDMNDLEFIEDAALRPLEMIGRGVLLRWVAGGCGVRAAVTGRGDEKPHCLSSGLIGR